MKWILWKHWNKYYQSAHSKNTSANIFVCHCLSCNAFKPVFFSLRHLGHRNIAVICLTVVLKLAVAVFIGLYFQTFWSKWFTFFLVISKTFRSMTEKKFKLVRWNSFCGIRRPVIGIGVIRFTTEVHLTQLLCKTRQRLPVVFWKSARVVNNAKHFGRFRWRHQMTEAKMGQVFMRRPFIFEIDHGDVHEPYVAKHLTEHYVRVTVVFIAVFVRATSCSQYSAQFVWRESGQDVVDVFDARYHPAYKIWQRLSGKHNMIKRGTCNRLASEVTNEHLSHANRLNW